MCNWKYVFAVFISNFYNFLNPIGLLEFSNWIQNLTKQFERMQYVLARGSGRIETVQHRSISPLFVYMYIYIYIWIVEETTSRAGEFIRIFNFSCTRIVSPACNVFPDTWETLEFQVARDILDLLPRPPVERSIIFHTAGILVQR